MTGLTAVHGNNAKSTALKYIGPGAEEVLAGGMNMSEGRKTYTIRNDEGVSTVKIAEEIVAIIAGMAATEAKGVTCLAGNITNDMIPKKGAKSLSKGVRIVVDEENRVEVDLALTIEYGYSIPEVSLDVQEHVKSAIENMTGMKVMKVNISVFDVDMNDED